MIVVAGYWVSLATSRHLRTKTRSRPYRDASMTMPKYLPRPMLLKYIASDLPHTMPPPSCLRNRTEMMSPSRLVRTRLNSFQSLSTETVSLTPPLKLSASCRSATSRRNVGYSEAVLLCTKWPCKCQGALAQPTKAFRAEISAAAMALAAYELLQGTNTNDSRGRMHHIEGASSYLNAFPELFHFLELLCIFDALGARKSSCFSTSKWWQGTVDRFGDSIYGASLRMITSLRTVLEQCDESMGLPASVEEYERWSSLIKMASRMESAFLDWFQMMTAQLSLCQCLNA